MHTRYQGDMYNRVHEQSGRFVNLSGTAIICLYYRLKHMLEAVFWWENIQTLKHTPSR